MRLLWLQKGSKHMFLQQTWALPYRKFIVPKEVALFLGENSMLLGEIAFFFGECFLFFMKVGLQGTSFAFWEFHSTLWKTYILPLNNLFWTNIWSSFH
jgi:hypothetical protein